MEEIPEPDEQLASSLWREVREKAKDKQSGRISPPFPFMDTYHPLEDQWAANSLNRRTATRSLCQEPRHKNVVASKPSQSQKNHDDLEGVIANQALSSLVTCTLPLKDLLRVRPGIWRKMA